MGVGISAKAVGIQWLLPSVWHEAVALGTQRISQCGSGTGMGGGFSHAGLTLGAYHFGRGNEEVGLMIVMSTASRVRTRDPPHLLRASLPTHPDLVLIWALSSQSPAHTQHTPVDIY